MAIVAEPLLTIIVVSYETRQLTLACLDSIAATRGALDLELLVVDNASTDGSAEAIRAGYPDARLTALEKNIGFAGANNLAAKEARGRYLLLLNPDTVVWEGTLQALVEFADQHPEAGIVGGATYFPDGSLNPSSCWGRPTLWSTFCLGVGLSSVFRRNALCAPESLGTWQRDSVRQVDAVSGCLLLIRRELWEELEGFDEEFFMYGEDMDLCLRAAATGTRCMIQPAARIVHLGGASERVRSDKMVRLFRARAQLYAKHWSPAAAVVGRRMLDLWALTRTVALSLLAILQPGRRASRDAWREIWRRRREWGADAQPGTSKE